MTSGILSPNVLLLLVSIFFVSCAHGAGSPPVSTQCIRTRTHPGKHAAYLSPNSIEHGECPLPTCLKTVYPPLAHFTFLGLIWFLHKRVDARLLTRTLRPQIQGSQAPFLRPQRAKAGRVVCLVHGGFRTVSGHLSIKEHAG